MAENPEIVIWSETSFVPAIDWHTRYRPDNETYGLVKELQAFLDTQTVPYVVGNDDGELQRTAENNEVRVDYNAAILFDKGRIVDTYRKLHLVPFTEIISVPEAASGDLPVAEGRGYALLARKGTCTRFLTPTAFAFRRPSASRIRSATSAGGSSGGARRSL